MWDDCWWRKLTAKNTSTIPHARPLYDATVRNEGICGDAYRWFYLDWKCIGQLPILLMLPPGLHLLCYLSIYNKPGVLRSLHCVIQRMAT